MQVLKQRVSRRCRGKKRKAVNQMRFWEEETPRAFWQARYYDFNVFREKKYVEKLRYIHRKPCETKPGGISGDVAVEQFPRLLFGRSRQSEDRVDPGPTLCSERKNQRRALRKGWGTLIVVRVRKKAVQRVGHPS